MTILEDTSLTEQWKAELAEVAKRLNKNRERLYYELSAVRKTPGDWKFLMEDKGLFSLTGLSQTQVDLLIERHIYLPCTGHINVAGLNEGNMARVADAIDSVVRETQN
jgi:aspartate aminotransferase